MSIVGVALVREDNRDLIDDCCNGRYPRRQCLGLRAGHAVFGRNFPVAFANFVENERGDEKGRRRRIGPYGRIARRGR